MSEHEKVQAVGRAIDAHLRRALGGCWTKGDACEHGNCACHLLVSGAAMAALSAARPDWVRLPDTRPAEWPWEGMMPEDVVGVTMPGGIGMWRLGMCWSGKKWRFGGITHVAPWSDIEALLPGGGE